MVKFFGRTIPIALKECQTCRSQIILMFPIKFERVPIAFFQLQTIMFTNTRHKPLSWPKLVKTFHRHQLTKVLFSYIPYSPNVSFVCKEQICNDSNRLLWVELALNNQLFVRRVRFCSQECFPCNRTNDFTR